MDVFDCIRERHSYRGEFTAQAVSHNDLRRIAQAGVDAPSGCNRQTTEFIIIDQPEILARVRAVVNMPAVQTAPALLVCVIDEVAPRSDDYRIEDCAAAVENMLLAITALGYASVWIDGALRAGGAAQRLGEIFKVGAGKIVRVILPVGVAAREIGGPHKLPAEKRVFWNAYGE